MLKVSSSSAWNIKCMRLASVKQLRQTFSMSTDIMMYPALVWQNLDVLMKINYQQNAMRAKMSVPLNKNAC